MKTLREYIDQLDEISRRGFLKGAGATAAGAALGKLPPAQAQSASSISRYAADLAVKTVLRRLHQDTGYDLRNFISKNIYKYVSTMCAVGRCPDRELINRVNQLAAEEAGITKLNFVTGMLTNMKDHAEDFVLAYANHLTDELDKSLSNTKQPDPSTSKDQDVESPSVLPKTGTELAGPVRPGFEGKVIDAGLVLYVYASKSNHESKDAIKAALNNYASKTGLANNINQRLKQITVDPSKFGPSTGPNQYFQQANQLIRNINALTEKVNEAYALEEDPVEKINKLFKKGS